MIDISSKISITELNTIIFHLTMGRNNTKSFLNRMESTGSSADYQRLENELQEMEALVKKLTGIRDQYNKDVQAIL